MEIADPKEKSSIWADQQMINSPTHYNDEYKMTANKQNQSQLSKGLARQLGTNLRGDDAYNGMNQIYKHATSFNRSIYHSQSSTIRLTTNQYKHKQKKQLHCHIKAGQQPDQYESVKSGLGGTKEHK